MGYNDILFAHIASELFNYFSSGCPCFIILVIVESLRSLFYTILTGLVQCKHFSLVKQTSLLLDVRVSVLNAKAQNFLYNISSLFSLPISIHLYVSLIFKYRKWFYLLIKVLFFGRIYNTIQLFMSLSYQFLSWIIKKQIKKVILISFNQTKELIS